MTRQSSSSLITKPYKYVLAQQGSFTESPKLALESLLASYGVPQADLFTASFLDYVKGDYISLLKLLVFMESFGVAQFSSWLQLLLQEPYEEVKKRLERALPYSAEVDYPATFDVVVEQGLSDLQVSLFGYPSFLLDNIYDPLYLLTWISEAEPVLADELDLLKKDDLLFFLVAYISRVTKTDLLRSKSSVKQLSSVLSKAVSVGALGDNPDQHLYFPYVSAIAANS
jgi:hypothetical protein